MNIFMFFIKLEFSFRYLFFYFIKTINDFVFDFNGKFHIDKNSIDLDVNRLFVSLDSTEFDMQLKDSKISLLPAKIVCNDLNGNIDSLGIKGQFIKSATICTTMGPGIKLDLQEMEKIGVKES